MMRDAIVRMAEAWELHAYLGSPAVLARRMGDRNCAQHPL
jgi:hypothetical protein